MLSQFTAEPASTWASLAGFVNCPGVYPVGRLDADSEGLLLLSDNGVLQQRLLDPRHGHWRRYQAQVEGLADSDRLKSLRAGVLVQGRLTLPARARQIDDPGWPERDPPIRRRLSIPTSWLELELREGRNRQVRRMTAAVGLPTLRLLRVAIDLMDGGPPLDLGGLAPGKWRLVSREEAARLDALVRRPFRAGFRAARPERLAGDRSPAGGERTNSDHLAGSWVTHHGPGQSGPRPGRGGSGSRRGRNP